jgi:hypothetical protein
VDLFLTAGLTDLLKTNKDLTKKNIGGLDINRSGPALTDSGPLRPTVPCKAEPVSIPYRARLPRRDETQGGANPSDAGSIGSSPGGGVGRWRWSRKVEAGQGRASAVSWVHARDLGLHADGLA